PNLARLESCAHYAFANRKRSTDLSLPFESFLPDVPTDLLQVQLTLAIDGSVHRNPQSRNVSVLTQKAIYCRQEREHRKLRCGGHRFRIFASFAHLITCFHSEEMFPVAKVAAPTVVGSASSPRSGR